MGQHLGVRVSGDARIVSGNRLYLGWEKRKAEKQNEPEKCEIGTPDF